MNDPHDPNRTVDVSAAEPDPGRTVDDVPSSAPPDSLDAGLAAGFGRPMAPRSSLGDLRPVLLKEAEGESAHIVKPKSDAMPPKEEVGDRYRLDGEIARGGMGAVLRGRDVDLGRDLAVKVLLEKHAGRPEVARRFVEEAQIGGQLQHPGVVPVYDIGRFGDRPYFTMKLVKGQTLAQILSKRERPTEDRPRLLGIALKISETLAYAHAKGVIHRDLKPANVMVGVFGEVQVMDWGLAKVLAEGGIDDEGRANLKHLDPQDGTRIRTARSSGSTGGSGSETEAGSLLGTPAYMPPEQANGDVVLVDRRADVFGLGAILCEMLTGRPPYVGRSGEEVRRKAANGDLSDATARLDACGGDAELVALTKTCLSPEAIDRPKDAQEVTDGLSAYLNGVQERLQTAERERAVAVVREAEQQKRRRVQVQLATAVAVLVLGGVSVAWWQTEQAATRRVAELRQQVADEQRAAADAARLARNAEAVAGLLGQAEEALKAGDAARAAVVLEAAAKRSAEGGAELDAERLKRLNADLALVRDLDAVDQFHWTLEKNEFPDPAVAARRTREALRRFGADPDTMSVDDAAARVSGSVVRQRIVYALDRLLREKTAGGRALLRRVDADAFRDAFRDAVLANNGAKIAELASQNIALEQPPGFAAFLGESTAIPVERRRQLLESAAIRRPGDLNLLMVLGSTYHGQKGRLDEELRWYQAAIAASPANVAAHYNLGIALHYKGQFDGALACYRKAIALDPKYARAHYNLGVALADKDQVDETVACFRKAIALDPKDAKAHTGLGVALHRKGQFDGAVACHRKAIALDPKDAKAHSNLGAALHDKGQVEEAIACYRKAIALDPKDAKAHYNLGVALAEKGQVDEAITCYRTAVELDPKDAKAHTGLGVALHRKGQFDEAIACHRKAIALAPKDALAHCHLGTALFGKGQPEEALACYRKAIALDPKYANAHCNLGIALAEKGQVDEAITCYRTAVELDPKFALAHCNLGTQLFGKGRLDEAIGCFRKAIALDPKDATAHCNLGAALHVKGEGDEAVTCLRKAIALDPKDAKAHTNMGVALRDKGQVDVAIAYFTKAVELDPKSANARTQLAKAQRLKAGQDKLPLYLKGEFQPTTTGERLDLVGWCTVKKLHHAAARLYAAAFAADPKLADDLKAGHRYNAACFASMAAAGQGEDAAKLGDAERARLRKQALAWLGADLALRTKHLESGKPADRAEVRRAMLHWQKDADLAGIRDAAALAKLPAEEQKAIARFWSDVAEALKKAESTATKEDRK